VISFVSLLGRRDVNALFSMISDDAEPVMDEGGPSEYVRRRHNAQ